MSPNCSRRLSDGSLMREPRSGELSVAFGHARTVTDGQPDGATLLKQCDRRRLITARAGPSAAFPVLRDTVEWRVH